MNAWHSDRSTPYRLIVAPASSRRNNCNLSSGHLRAILISDLSTERQIVRDSLQIMCNNNARAVDEVGVPDSERSCKVCSPVVRCQLCGCKFVLLDLKLKVNLNYTISSWKINRRTCEANLHRTFGANWWIMLAFKFPEGSMSPRMTGNASFGPNCFVPTYVAPNLYPLGAAEQRLIVCDTWKWLLNPLFTISFAPSKKTGITSVTAEGKLWIKLQVGIDRL